MGKEKTMEISGDGIYIHEFRPKEKKATAKQIMFAKKVADARLEDYHVALGVIVNEEEPEKVIEWRKEVHYWL